MNNHQLDSLLRHMVGDSFGGVWASDQLPQVKQLFRYPVYMIVNTHPSHMPGEHWLAMTLEGENVGTFFDSFGFPPNFSHYPKSILQFLEKQCKTILHHNCQLQNVLSTACGQHCVFYLCKRASGLSYEDVLSLYQDDVIKNDATVTNFVKKYQRCERRHKDTHFNHSVCSLQMFKDCYKM